MNLALAFAVAVLVAGCSAMPPHRVVNRADPASCRDIYAAADVAPHDPDWVRKSRRLIWRDLDSGDDRRVDCWRSAGEFHEGYELHTVEFDDQGWLASRSVGAHPDTVAQLFARLDCLSRRKQPVSLVVYTHGWHHTAAPDDSNVIAFRRLLRGLEVLERQLCRRQSGCVPIQVEPDACEQGRLQPADALPPWQKQRQVVGVYVGWRGDSLHGPLIENLSVWDRKLAAESVAYGAVQELFARLHDFYVRHGCHSSRSPLSCIENADARMIAIGHSFGALITYRALAPRLMSAMIERGQQGERSGYAHSYGDMTVLVNPAFEATRLEHLAHAAASRTYDTGEGEGRTAQLPVLLVVQSKGDLATRDAFPAFRNATTIFESTTAEQYEPNVTAAGWSPRYKTHDLSMDGANVCPGWSDEGPLEARIAAEAEHMDKLRATRYRDFHGDFTLCPNFVARRSRPGFTPIFSLQADPAIVRDHNDFLNARLQQFLRQMYRAVLAEQDQYQRTILAAAAKACREDGSASYCNYVAPRPVARPAGPDGR